MRHGSACSRNERWDDASAEVALPLCGSYWVLGLIARLGGQGGERAGFEALDAARVGVEHLELEFAGAPQDFASVGNATGRRGDEPADRVDPLGLGERSEIEADRLGNGVERGARLSDETSVPSRVKFRRLV